MEKLALNVNNRNKASSLARILDESELACKSHWETIRYTECDLVRVFKSMNISFYNQKRKRSYETCSYENKPVG